jgi:hypothetical protein
MTTTDKRDNQLILNIELVPKGEDQAEDPAELERVTHNLRDDLTEVDAIEKVDFIAKGRKENVAPKGSKAGGEIVALGSLLVTLGTAAGSSVIPSLVNTLQSWLTRHERHKISMEIGGDKLEVTGLSDDQQQKLIESWLGRLSKEKKRSPANA